MIFHHGDFSYDGSADPLLYGENLINIYPDTVWGTFNYCLGIFGFIYFSYVPGGENYPDVMNLCFLCETAPYYFEWMLYLERALYDENDTPSQADKDYAKLVEEGIRKTGKFPKGVDVGEAQSQESVFAGMTPEEYADYTGNYFNTPVEGFTNLKVGEIFYLRENDFKIFLVSGAERAYTSILAEVLDVDSDNIIGTDYRYVAENRGDKDGMDYIYKTTDKVVRSDFFSKNINMNKVNLMVREIGKQPVLAFGNSSGDFSMFNYTSTNPKYKTKVFVLLCDDTEREFGKSSSAKKCKMKTRN